MHWYIMLSAIYNIPGTARQKKLIFLTNFSFDEVSLKSSEISFNYFQCEGHLRPTGQDLIYISRIHLLHLWNLADLPNPIQISFNIY